MISVIGGGPAGSYVASLLAKDYNTTIYEEHERIGVPIQCTGIVSKNLQEIVDLKKSTVNKVKGAFIYSANEKLELRTNNVQAYVVCRTKFDNYVKETAINNGAKIMLGHRFMDYKKTNTVFNDKYSKLKIKMQVKNGDIVKEKLVESDYLIGADGPNSSVAKSSGLFGKRKFWIGVQATVEGSFDPEMVEVHLGSVCPGFFAWVVPENESVARIGLACYDKPNYYFQKFMDKLWQRQSTKEPKIVDWQGGLIPCYDKIQCQKENVFLVGDSGLHVKATTGGGIVMAMLAGQALNESIRTEKSYDELLQKKVGRDLKMAKTIRTKLDGFNDNDYDALLRLLNSGRSAEILKKAGDMDFPTRFMFKLLLNEPRLLKFAFK